jgi:hypothetical protein
MGFALLLGATMLLGDLAAAIFTVPGSKRASVSRGLVGLAVPIFTVPGSKRASVLYRLSWCCRTYFYCVCDFYVIQNAQ